MSSVWNHVPSRSRVCSLGAAHLFSRRPCPKEARRGSPFRPNPSIHSPHSISNVWSSSLLSRPTSSASGPMPLQHHVTNGSPHDSPWDDSINSSDVWYELRLRSRLNQSYVPSSETHQGRKKQAVSQTSTTTTSCTPPRPYSSNPECHFSEIELSQSTLALPGDSDASSREVKGKRRLGRSATERRNPRRISKRRVGEFSPTPTEYLIDTLHNVTQTSYGIAHNWMSNAKNPDNLPITPLTREQRIKFKIHHRMSLQQLVADYIYQVDQTFDKINQGEVLPTAVEPDLDLALRKVFITREHRKYLKTRGYDVADVVAWAWILKSKTTYQAILRILALEADQGRQRPRATPSFIPLLLLRQNLDTKTFRLLLIYSLHLITGQRLPTLNWSLNVTTEEAGFNPQHLSGEIESLIDPNTCATFAIRLLYHARKLWPEAQLPIARAFSFYLSAFERKGSDGALAATSNNVQVIAQTSNTLLRLLSLPCKTAPFISASVQQEAQFELLKAMAKNRPVLPVTRQGYQAIIAVQLAHKKTFDERQVAELKAPSWPPWREDKLGIDSLRGTEGVKSRAMQVMSQMKEAGYAHSRWEEVSSILAGWDIDNSPTIQTRTLSRHPGLLRGPTGDRSHHAIWEARIRATRTVREAWAGFLAYQQQGLPPRVGVYVAMAEKLIHRKKTNRSNFDRVSAALPGDGVEVFPEPLSARDVIYVPTEPPTLDELLTKMLSEGIRPSGRFLALLLRSAPTISSGLDYISCSDLSNDQVKALCTVWRDNPSYTTHSRKALDELPDYLFSSFIHFLCKFSDFNKLIIRYGGATADAFPVALNSHAMSQDTTTLFNYPGSPGLEHSHQYLNTLSHAIELLKVRSSRSPQPWVHILSALNRVRITARARSLSTSTQSVLAWYEMLEVTFWMKKRDIDLGLQGFQTLCKGFSRAVIAGVRDPRNAEEGLVLISHAKRCGGLGHVELGGLHVEDMANGGLKSLKHQFDQLVFSDPTTSSLYESSAASIQQKTDSQVTVPSLCRVPSPAVLHAFVRSLGLAEDYDGLLNLLRWMSQYAVPIKEASDERLNSDRIMRRTLVAIRMFLEGCWGEHSWHNVPRATSAQQAKEVEYLDDFPDDPPIEKPLSDSHLQEAHDIVTATGIWGSWPSDEEVQEYLAVHWG